MDGSGGQKSRLSDPPRRGQKPQIMGRDELKILVFESFRNWVTPRRKRLSASRAL
jgi:hypothetical protein